MYQFYPRSNRRNGVGDAACERRPCRQDDHLRLRFKLRCMSGAQTAPAVCNLHADPATANTTAHNLLRDAAHTAFAQRSRIHRRVPDVFRFIGHRDRRSWPVMAIAPGATNRRDLLAATGCG